MGKFTLEEAKNYIKGNAGFFGLADDGDTAIVRFLYRSSSDVEGYEVHPVKYKGLYKNVLCLRDSNEDPIEDCPFCNNEYPKYQKFYIPLLDVESGDVKIWERGLSFYKILTNLCSKYYPLCDEIFEIERVGAAKDKNTRYTVNCVTDDYDSDDPIMDFDIENYDIPIPYNEDNTGAVLSRSFEDCEYYIENGKFEDDNVHAPVNDNFQNDSSHRRRSSRRSEENTHDELERRYSTRRNRDSSRSRRREF